MDPKLEQVSDAFGSPTWKLTYDGEVHGAIISIQPFGYGIGIEVNGKYLCAIDLWHMSDESDDEDDAHGCSQVVIDPEDGGDSLLFIRRFPDGHTEVIPESGIRHTVTNDGILVYPAPMEAE